MVLGGGLEGTLRGPVGKGSRGCSRALLGVGYGGWPQGCHRGGSGVML